MMTDTEIKHLGFRALVNALGMVEAERFVSLIQREPFDYTSWQRQLWNNQTIEDLSAAAMRLRSRCTEEIGK